MAVHVVVRAKVLVDNPVAQPVEVAVGIVVWEQQVCSSNGGAKYMTKI